MQNQEEVKKQMQKLMPRAPFSSVPPTYTNELELFVRSEESGVVSRRCTAPKGNFVSPEEVLREALANKPPSPHFAYDGCTAAESVKAPASQVLTTIPGGGAPSWETGGCAVRATEKGGWSQSELYNTTSSSCSVEVELLSRRKSTVVTPYTSQGQAAKLPCVIYRGEIVCEPLLRHVLGLSQPKGTDRGMPLDVAGEKDHEELESA
jgi:hypothetical protein